MEKYFITKHQMELLELFVFHIKQEEKDRFIALVSTIQEEQQIKVEEGK